MEVLASTDGVPFAILHSFEVPGVFTYDFIEGTLVDVRTVGPTGTTDLFVSVYPADIAQQYNLLTESGDQLVTEAGETLVTG